MLRMNAAERGVEGQLSDRDAHPARALVAKSQDPLPIADHDAFHAVITGMIQHLRNTILIWIAEKNTSGLSPYLAEPLAALAHRRRVHQRKHLFYIAQQKRIEQRFVYILQIAQKTIFNEGARLIAQHLNPARNLFIQISHMRRQQTVQIKRIPLVVRERSSLVKPGRIDQVISGKRNLAARAGRLSRLLAHSMPF